MPIFNPFSKKTRQKKRRKKEIAELSRQKALMLYMQYQRDVLNRSEPGIGNQEKDEIIISLTSIPSRLDNVVCTIESLMQQTLKADKIILCLGEKNIDTKQLPISLQLLKKKGLDIRFYEEDLGPYTKYYYTLKENPNSLIITADDDILYPCDMVEKLYHAYKAEPNVIHCHRGHRITFTNNKLSSYRDWKFSAQTEHASQLIFPTGVGGVLYFPGSLHEDALNKDAFLELCPKADDVWLKAMSLLNNIKCKTIKQTAPFSFAFPNIPLSQEVTLKRGNKKTNGNDSKIAKVFGHYKIYKYLK